MTTFETRNRKLGETGPEVFPLALGCMGMSGMYGVTDDKESVATIHAAIDAGVNLLDTGDFYGSGHNESLIRQALADRPGKAMVSVKFGALRSPDGGWVGVDNRPAAVMNFASYSLKRLGLEVIDIYRPARLDPNVPIEETVGAIAELVKKGYVRHIGLSEVGVETIQRARKFHPIVDLQIEYSLASRGPEAEIFPALEEMGISATLYGVLSRGLLSGRRPTGPRDFRSYLPRFSSEHRGKNDEALRSFESLAQRLDRSSAQLALAWVLTKQPRLVPLIGPKTRRQLGELLEVLHRPLTAEETGLVEATLGPEAITGTRYAAVQMAHLDSEVQKTKPA